ncbi:class I SAM-dependent methyltransferase [Flavobacteriaceae bacterium MHTCC 0001]
MIKDNTKRFSDRVENYVKYRPGYPKEIIPFLEKVTDLTVDSKIADIGSGTGKCTEIFLDSGYEVAGVEPNLEMRMAAEALFEQQPLFKSIKGSAEDTSLEAESYSHIIAGQAFHWFDPALAKKEFQRILTSGGWVVLIWNERDVQSPFLADYELFLHEHAVKYSEVVHRNIDENAFETFYEPFSYDIKSIPSYQLFDFEGILGRYLSSSYAYNEGEKPFEAAKEGLQVLFEKHKENNTIKMEYLTNIYYGQLK